TAPTAGPVAQHATSVSTMQPSGTTPNLDAGQTFATSVPRDIEEAKDAVELLEVQLEGKRAELLEVRALVEQTKRQLDRVSKLRAQGNVSEEELEQLRTELAVREARLRAKEAQVKEAEVRLRQAKRVLSRLQGGSQRSGSTGISSSTGTKLAPTATGVTSGG